MVSSVMLSSYLLFFGPPTETHRLNIDSKKSLTGAYVLFCMYMYVCVCLCVYTL